MIRFETNDPKGYDPIRIEHVFAEKPNGGIVEEPRFDAPESTAVYADGKKFKVIKGYRLVAECKSSDTSIKVAKGSGVAANDFIGFGTKAVKATSVNTSNAAYDTVTVTMGVAIPAGTVLYQAKAASTDAAEPIGKPEFVTGNYVYNGKGDQPVRLVNGANLRKATANIGEDIASLMPSIALV